MLKKIIKILLLVFILIAVVLGYAYFIEPNSLAIKNQAIKLDCLKNDLEDRFIQISDLHFTDKTKKVRIDQIYEAVKSQNPAAVFVTGDLVSNETGVAKANELVGKIAADYKTFVILEICSS